jgi:hypothetical protein
MRTPGLRLPQGTRQLRPKYDPVHDAVVVLEQSGTWIYSVHNNEWVRAANTPGPGTRRKYGAAVDEKRGIYYMIGGTSASYCPDYVDDMWGFDPATRTWTQVTSLPNAPWNVYPVCNDYVTTIAYSTRSDVILYVDRAGTTFAFDCETKAWQQLSPSISTNITGRIAYEAKNNLFYLLGGSSGDTADMRSIRGFWAYKYRDVNAAWDAKLPAPYAWMDITANSATISWSNQTASGFNVYRANADPYPRTYVKLNTSPVTGTTYQDNSVTAGESYAFRVVALDGSGGEGHYSKHLYTRPARPMGAAASVEESTVVKVSWEPNTDPGITGYHVYRGRGIQMFHQTFMYTKLTSTPVSGTEFPDTLDLSDGVSRAYVVTAVNVFGCESGYSPAATTFPHCPWWFKCYKKQGSTLYYQFSDGPTSTDSTQIHWQPPPRTKILGVNIYRGATYDRVVPPFNTSGYITDTVTTWYTRGTYGAGTFTLRAVNMLGQEGWITDQISPDHSHYTNGTPPLDPFVPPSAISRNRVLPAAGQQGLFCYPNPSRRKISIRLMRAQAGFGHAPVTVFNVSGRMVARLKTGKRSAVEWNTRGMPAGLYLVRVKIDGKTFRKKVVLIK